MHRKKQRSRGEIREFESKEFHRPQAEIHIPHQSQGYGEIYVPTYSEVERDSGGGSTYHGAPIPRIG